MGEGMSELFPLAGLPPRHVSPPRKEGCRRSDRRCCYGEAQTFRGAEGVDVSSCLGCWDQLWSRHARQLHRRRARRPRVQGVQLQPQDLLQGDAGGVCVCQSQGRRPGQSLPHLQHVCPRSRTAQLHLGHPRPPAGWYQPLFLSVFRFFPALWSFFFLSGLRFVRILALLDDPFALSACFVWCCGWVHGAGRDEKRGMDWVKHKEEYDGESASTQH
mmetsp:Transcript_51180/g.102260  ORF Transcript_51180/g.102260 Transcript_51180/m.102260 type:complete len:216 (-) Transcript_51180:102-749(-)